MPSSRRRRDAGGTAIFGSAGWLFADLMLALVAAFLIANTVGQSTPLPRCSDVVPAAQVAPVAATQPPDAIRSPATPAAPASTAAPGDLCAAPWPTPTSPSPTPTRPLRLNPTPIEVTIDVSYPGIRANDAGAVQDALNQVRQHAPALFQSTRAGMVLVFGGAPVASLSEGKAFASSFADNVLRRAGPGFADTLYRPYWTAASLGTVQLIIFYFD